MLPIAINAPPQQRGADGEDTSSSSSSASEDAGDPTATAASGSGREEQEPPRATSEVEQVREGAATGGTTTADAHRRGKKHASRRRRKLLAHSRTTGSIMLQDEVSTCRPGMACWFQGLSLQRYEAMFDRVARELRRNQEAATQEDLVTDVIDEGLRSRAASQSHLTDDDIEVRQLDSSCDEVVEQIIPRPRLRTQVSKSSSVGAASRRTPRGGGRKLSRAYSEDTRASRGPPTKRSLGRQKSLQLPRAASRGALSVVSAALPSSPVLGGLPANAAPVTVPPQHCSLRYLNYDSAAAPQQAPPPFGHPHHGPLGLGEPPGPGGPGPAFATAGGATTTSRRGSSATGASTARGADHTFGSLLNPDDAEPTSRSVSVSGVYANGQSQQVMQHYNHSTRRESSTMSASAAAPLMRFPSLLQVPVLGLGILRYDEEEDEPEPGTVATSSEGVEEEVLEVDADSLEGEDDDDEDGHYVEGSLASRSLTPAKTRTTGKRSRNTRSTTTLQPRGAPSVDGAGEKNDDEDEHVNEVKARLKAVHKSRRSRGNQDQDHQGRSNMGKSPEESLRDLDVNSIQQPSASVSSSSALATGKNGGASTTGAPGVSSSAPAAFSTPQKGTSDEGGLLQEHALTLSAWDSATARRTELTSGTTSPTTATGSTSTSRHHSTHGKTSRRRLRSRADTSLTSGYERVSVFRANASKRFQAGLVRRSTDDIALGLKSEKQRERQTGTSGTALTMDGAAGAGVGPGGNSTLISVSLPADPFRDRIPAPSSQDSDLSSEPRGENQPPTAAVEENARTWHGTGATSKSKSRATDVFSLFEAEETTIHDLPTTSERSGAEEETQGTGAPTSGTTHTAAGGGTAYMPRRWSQQKASTSSLEEELMTPGSTLQEMLAHEQPPGGTPFSSRRDRKGKATRSGTSSTVDVTPSTSASAQKPDKYAGAVVALSGRELAKRASAEEAQGTDSDETLRATLNKEKQDAPPAGGSESDRGGPESTSLAPGGGPQAIYAATDYPLVLQKVPGLTPSLVYECAVLPQGQRKPFPEDAANCLYHSLRKLNDDPSVGFISGEDGLMASLQMVAHQVTRKPCCMSPLLMLPTYSRMYKPNSKFIVCTVGVSAQDLYLNVDDLAERVGVSPTKFREHFVIERFEDILLEVEDVAKQGALIAWRIQSHFKVCSSAGVSSSGTGSSSWGNTALSELVSALSEEFPHLVNKKNVTRGASTRKQEVSSYLGLPDNQNVVQVPSARPLTTVAGGAPGALNKSQGQEQQLQDGGPLMNLSAGINGGKHRLCGIFLECTEMSVHSDFLREMLAVPVYDMVALSHALMLGYLDNPLFGRIGWQYHYNQNLYGDYVKSLVDEEGGSTAASGKREVESGRRTGGGGGRGGGDAIMGPLRALKNSEADGAAAGEAVVAEQVVPYVYAQSMLEKRLTVGGHGRTVDVRKFGTAAFSRGASAVILPAADAGGGEAPEAEMAQAAEGLEGGTSSAVFNTASFNADHASAERELESYTARSYPAPASAEDTSRSRETSKGVAGDCTDEDRASYQARRGQVQALIEYLLAKKKAEEQAGGSPINPPLPPRVGHHTTHSTQPALGCLRIDSLYRPAAGDVADPRSHEYPLVNRVVPGLTFEVVRSGKLDRAVRRNFVTAVKYLDKHPAVKVITGDCGFMMFFQELAQAYTRKPVALSSLMLITGLNQFIHPEKQICIVTANSGDLEPLIPVVSRVCGMGLQVFADADHGGHDGGSMTGSMLDLVSGTGGAGYSNAPGSSTTGGAVLAAAAAQQQPLPSFAVGGSGSAPLQNYAFGPGIGMASAAPGGAPASAGAPMLSGTLGGGVGAPTSSATAGTGPGRPAAGGQVAGSVSYLDEKSPSVGSSSSIARTDSSALSTASSQPKQEQSKMPASADQMNRTPVAGAGAAFAEAPATSDSKSQEYSKAFQFVSHDGKTMNLLAEKLQKLSLVDQDRGGEGEQNGDGKISKPQNMNKTQTTKGQKQNNFLDAGAFADELSSKLSALTQAFDAVEQDGKVPGQRPPLEAPPLQPGGERAAEESAVTTQVQKPSRAVAGMDVGAGAAAAAELRPAAHGEHLTGATAQDEKVDTDVERNVTSEGKIQGGRGKEEDAQGCARAQLTGGGVVTSSTTPGDGDHLTLIAATPATGAFVDVTTVEHILDETTALAAQDVFGAQSHEMRTLKEMFHDEQEARKAHEDPHAPSPELKPIAAGGGAPTSALGLGAGGGFALGGGSSRGGSPGTGSSPGAALGPTESVSSPRGTGSSVTSLNTSAGPSSIAPSANNSPLAGKAEPAAGGATGDAIFKLVPDAGAGPSGAPGQQNVKRQWQLSSTGAFHQSYQQQGGAGEQQTASGKTAGSSLTEASVAGTGSATIGTGTSSQRSNESSSLAASASGSIAPGTQIKLGTGDHPMTPTDSSSGHDFHIWHPRLQHLVAGDILQGPEQDISPCSPELKSIPKLSRTQKLTSIDPFAAGEQTVRSLSNLDDTDLDSSSFSLSRHSDVFARSRGYHERSLQGVGAHSMSGSLSMRGRAGGDTSLGEYTSRTRRDGRTALGALLLSKASRAQAGGTNSPRDQNLVDGIHLNFGRQAAQTASIKSNSLEKTTSGAPSSNSKNSSLDVAVAGTARTSSSDVRGSEGGLAARSDSNLSGGLPTTPSHANTNRSSSISGARAHRGSDDDRTSWTGRDARGLWQPDFSTMTDDASAASRNRMYPVGLNNNAADGSGTTGATPARNNDPPARNRNAPGVLFSKLRVDSLSGGGEQLSPRAGPGAGAAAPPNHNLQHLREAPAAPAAARPAASDEVDDDDEEVDDDEEPPSLQRSSRYGETTSSSSSRLRHGVRTHSASPVPPQGDNMRPNPLSSLLVGGATPTFSNAAASTRKDYLEDIHVPVALPEGLTPALTRVAEHGQTILGRQQSGKDASCSMNNDVEAPSSSSLQGQVRRLSQTATGPIEPGARISFANMRRRSEEHHEHAKTTQHAAEATAGTHAQGRASVSDNDQSYNLEPSSLSSSGAGMPFSAPPPPPSFLPDTTSSILGPIEQDFILHDVLTPGERAATAMLGPPTAAHDATQLEAITEDKELVLVTSSVTNNSFLLDHHHLDVASAQNSHSVLNVSSSLDTSMAAAMDAGPLFTPPAVENYPSGATTAADHREISASFQQFLQKANETFQQQQKEKLRVAAAQAVDGGSCAVAEEGNIADLGPATPSPAPGAAALQQQHHQNQHHVLFDLTEQEPTSSGSTVVPSNLASPVHESGTVVEPPPPLGAPGAYGASKRSKEDAGQHSSDDGSSGHRTPSRTGSSTAGKLMSPHQHHQADDQIGNQIQAAPGSSDNGAGAASTPSLHPTHSATTTNATMVPPSDGSALPTYHSPIVGAVKSVKSGSSSASLPQSQTVAAEELRSSVNYWGTLLGASNEMRKQVRRKQSVDEMALQPGLSLLCRSASTDEFLRQQQAAAFANEAYPTSQTPFSTAGGGTIASSLTNLNLASLAGIMKPPGGGAPGGGAAGSSDNGHAAEHQVILAGGAHQHLARSNSKGSSHFNLAGGGTGTLHQQYGSSALLSRRDSRYLEVTVVEHHLPTIGGSQNACAPQHASYPAAGVHPTPAWLQQRLNAAMLQPSTETRHIDRQRFVVMGIEDLDHFDGIAEGYPLNFKDCEPLFLQKVNKLLELHPEIDCFLAECTQLPMFSDSVRALFGRPVYDIVCAAHMIMLGFLQSEHQVVEDGEKTQQNGHTYGYESGINGYGTAAGIEGGINEAYIFGMELTLEERSQSAELQEFREMFAAAGIPLLEMKKVGGGGEKR